MSHLLNPANMYYLFKEKIWDWGSGDILNERGEIVGKMRRIILSLRADIELQEPDKTPIAKVRRKIIALRPQFDVVDMQDNILGLTKQKLLAIFRPEIWMENPQGQEIYRAKGNFMRWNFDIKSGGELVAQIRKADRWRDVFLGGVFDFSDSYAIHILNPDVDRLALLAFTIAIDNQFHDQQK
ncbi:MAG: LURP-one-related/scramblase family protein [Candidatus Ranarchaeia archaeon]